MGQPVQLLLLRGGLKVPSLSLASYMRPALLLVASFCSVVLIQLGGPTVDRITDRHIDADSAGFVLLIRDLVTGTASLSDWYLGTHLYFFPDGILTALALGLGAAGVPLRIAITAVFAAAQLSALAWIWSITFRRPYWLSFCSTAITLNLAYLLSYALCGGSPESGMMAHSLAPSTHQGSILVSCIVFALAVTFLEAPAPTPLWLLPCLLVSIGLASLSDVIFLVWGIVPLIAVAVSSGKMSRRVTILILAAVLASAIGLAGSTAFVAQHEFRMAYAASSRIGLVASAWSAIGFLGDGARFLTFGQGVLFYVNIVLWALSLYSVLRAWHGQPVRWGRTIVWCGSASAAALVAATGAGLFQGVLTLRYILPYVFFGYLAITCVLVVVFERWATKTAWVAVPVLSVVALAFYIAAPPFRYDQIAQCLRERDLTSGAAHYWDANPLLLATRSGVSVMPLLPEAVTPYAWNTNRSRLRAQPLQFIVSTRMLLPKIPFTLGVPTSVRPCADRVIVEYANAMPFPR